MKEKPREEIKVIKKMESIDEIFENKIGSLKDRIQILNEEEELELKNFLLKGNVSLEKFAVSPIENLDELEDVGKKQKKEDEKENIEYALLKKTEQSYDTSPKDDQMIPSKKSLLTPEELLKKHVEMYSPKKENKIEEKPIMQKLGEILQEKYKKKDYETMV